MSGPSRQRRAWLGALALFALALGLVMLFDRAPPETRLPPILAHLEAVEGLTLTPPEGEAIVFVRDPPETSGRHSKIPPDPSFTITAPRRTPADSPRVRALLALLLALGPGEMVEQTDSDAATFGLDHPTFRLEIDLGKRRRLLELGRVSPFDGRRYLRVDGRSLRLVSDALSRRLDPRLRHWREKRIVPWAPESLEHLRLESRDLSLTLDRRDGRWLRTAPGAGETPVDPRLARALVRDLGEARAVRFDLTRPDDALPPENTLPVATIEIGRGSRRSTLELHALESDDGDGVLAHGTPLSPWVRLRPGAFALLRRRFLALAP